MRYDAALMHGAGGAGAGADADDAVPESNGAAGHVGAYAPVVGGHGWYDGRDEDGKNCMSVCSEVVRERCCRQVGLRWLEDQRRNRALVGPVILGNAWRPRRASIVD